MLQLHSHRKPLVPRDIAIQIQSYLRIQWPFLDTRDGKLWDVPSDSPARTFIVLDGEHLVSHAEANFRTIEHAGRSFTLGGISAVFTYPAYRGGGFARQVVSAATALLDHSDADLAMLFCGESLRTFYASCGWAPADSARILRGDPAAPTPHEGNLVMMRFISGKGRAARALLENECIYVGERTW